MRVLVFGLSANRGGVESFILNYTRRILSQENDVAFDFVVFDEMPDCVDEFRKRGSRFYLLKNRVSDPLHFKSNLKSIFSNRDIDLVWYNVCTLSDITLLSVAHEEGVPCLVHSHNSQNMGNTLNLLLHVLHRTRISRLADSMCACSDLGARFMFPRRIVEQQDYTVVPNAIESSHFEFSSTLRKGMRERLGYPEDAYVLGNVGRLHPQKNQAFLLDVLKETQDVLPNARLLIVGDGPLKEQLLHQVEERGLNKSVTFVGAVADTTAYYSAMDCFVFPSRYEGFGIAALEAQASGLPCILSDSIPSDVALSRRTWRIPTDDAKRWASICIDQIGELAIEDRRNGAQLVQASGYDLSDTTAKVVDLLRSASSKMQP